MSQKGGTILQFQFADNLQEEGEYVEYEDGMTWNDFINSSYNHAGILPNTHPTWIFMSNPGEVTIGEPGGVEHIIFSAYRGYIDTVWVEDLINSSENEWLYYFQNGGGEDEGIEDEGSGGEVNPEGEDPSGNEGGGSTSEGEGSEPEPES